VKDAIHYIGNLDDRIQKNPKNLNLLRSNGIIQEDDMVLTSIRAKLALIEKFQK